MQYNRSTSEEGITSRERIRERDIISTHFIFFFLNNKFFLICYYLISFFKFKLFFISFFLSFLPFAGVNCIKLESVSTKTMKPAWSVFNFIDSVVDSVVDGQTDDE